MSRLKLADDGLQYAGPRPGSVNGVQHALEACRDLAQK